MASQVLTQVVMMSSAGRCEALYEVSENFKPSSSDHILQLFGQGANDVQENLNLNGVSMSSRFVRALARSRN